MTNSISNGNNHQYTQIVIQEDQISKYSDPQQSIQEIIQGKEQNNVYVKQEELKINRQKLLKYVALSQKNVNTGIVACKQKIYEADRQTNLMKTGKLKKAPSNPSLKQIKHKITTESTKHKMISNKENQLQPLFPKKNIKNSQSKDFLNKTTSAISFRTNNDKANNFNIKQQQSIKFYTKNMQSNHNLSKMSGKSSQSKFKIRSSKSRQNLCKTLNKAPSLSKFRYLNNNMESTHQMSVDHSQVMNALININQKQQNLLVNKKLLEQKVKQLRQNIQKQQSTIEQITANKNKMSSLKNKQEYMSRHSLDGVKLFKKKLQNCQAQSKNMENKLSEMAECNRKVTEAIDQERQLIKMYESVIEELKGQLKQQKQSKSDLQKKLAILKKNLKTAQSKANSQQNNTRQLFQKIFVSLDRWQ